MKPRRILSVARHLLPLAIAIAALIAAPSASAANWFWDGGTVDIAATGNGASGGTAGNWNTTTLNWDQGNALVHVAWDSAHTANFGGTAGAVAVGAGIAANGLTFTTAGYSFTTNAITMAAGSTITSLAGTQTFTGGLATADNILRFTNSNTTNNFGNATIFTVGGNIGGASTSVEINGSGTRAPVGFSGTLTWGGTTSVAANNAVHFLTATVTGLATGSINMAATSSIMRQSAIDNTFIGKIAATSNAFTIVQTNGSTGNALNLTNFPNASLAVWDNVGSGGFAFTGLITAGANGYRFGSTRAGNTINITTNANVLSGTAGLQLITGSLGNLNITNANNFTGNTINNASGKSITIGNNTAIQNSAIDTAGAGTYVTTVTTPTIGGLIGSKALLTNVFAATGYNLMTSLTLNPGTGVTNTYSGVIANSTAGLALTKSGLGTQILSGLNSFAGNITVSGGVLATAVAGSGGNSALGSVSNARTINVNTGGTLRFDVGNVFNNNFASSATSLPVLNIAGGTMTNAGAATNSALGNITLAGGTLTATTGSPAGGAFSGEGFGSWNLNGTVTSTGTSTISSTTGLGIPITLNATSGLSSPATIFDVTSGTLTTSAVLGEVTRSGNETVGSLTKSAAGTMILSGANTYSGLTTVDGGTLRITNASALGTTATGTVVNGTNTGSTANARLELAGGVTISGESLTISGVGNFLGALSSNSGNNEWAGNVTIGAASTRLGASANATLRVSGVIDSGVVATGLNIRTTNITDSTVILSGANTYLGDTNILVGKLQLDGGNNRLPVATNVILGATTNVNEFDLNGRNQEVAGLGIASGATAANNSINNSSATLSTLNVNTAAAASSFGGILKGNLALTKTGADTLTLGGANTYAGDTTISVGTLAISGGGSIANSSLIQINSATALDVAGITGTTFTLGATQTLAGNGTVLTGGKTVNLAGTLAPGASPGTLTQDGGTMQLAVGGDYNWQINVANGVAGTGYDTTSLISGGILDLSLLSAGNTYNINLWSLSGISPDVNGDATFDNALAYTWTLFSTGTAITGFSTDKFALNTSVFNGTNGFTNDLGGGSFSIGLADSDTNLVLNFTPVPEPRAALLGAIGLLMLLRRRR